MSNFWKRLERPIIAVSPMLGVTQEPFRQMLLKLGRPDVFWTGYVPADALVAEGREKFLLDLAFLNEEHPIVAQVIGKKPESFEKAAELIKELGFDGMDINMGCPFIGELPGAGSDLIGNTDLAKRIIRAAKKVAGEMPVSVKTGYREISSFENWASEILEENVAVLSFNLERLPVGAESFFGEPTEWGLAEKIVRLRDRLAPETLILVNGNIRSLERAHSVVEETGVDGVLIGRGVIRNPWFFSNKVPSPQERSAAMREHPEAFEKLEKYRTWLEGVDGTT